MSESHYWPGPDQPGTYTLEHHSGAVWKDAVWNGERWANKWSSFDPLEVLSWGYLGVRREPVRVTITGVSDLTPPPLSARDTEMIEMAAAESKVEELKAEADRMREDAFDWMLVANERGIEIDKLREEVSSLREQHAKPDLTALVREAIAEFRETVKQPTQAADLAFKWLNRFIEAVEK